MNTTDCLVKPGSYARVIGEGTDEVIRVHWGDKRGLTKDFRVSNAADYVRGEIVEVFPTVAEQYGLVLLLRAVRAKAVYSAVERNAVNVIINSVAHSLGIDPEFLPEMPWDRSVIKSLLPHRGPNKLLLDSVTEIEPGQSASGTYRVTPEVCKGHFGIFRGTDRVEAIQLLGAVVLMADPKYSDMNAMAWQILGKVETTRPAKPGDVVDLSIEFTGTESDRRGTFVIGNGVAKVGRHEVCRVEGLKCILVPAAK